MHKNSISPPSPLDTPPNRKVHAGRAQAETASNRRPADGSLVEANVKGTNGQMVRIAWKKEKEETIFPNNAEIDPEATPPHGIQLPDDFFDSFPTPPTGNPNHKMDIDHFTNAQPNNPYDPSEEPTEELLNGALVQPVTDEATWDSRSSQTLVCSPPVDRFDDDIGEIEMKAPPSLGAPMHQVSTQPKPKTIGINHKNQLTQWSDLSGAIVESGISSILLTSREQIADILGLSLEQRKGIKVEAKGKLMTALREALKEQGAGYTRVFGFNETDMLARAPESQGYNATRVNRSNEKIEKDFASSLSALKTDIENAKAPRAVRVRIDSLDHFTDAMKHELASVLHDAGDLIDFRTGGSKEKEGELEIRDLLLSKGQEKAKAALMTKAETPSAPSFAFNEPPPREKPKGVVSRVTSWAKSWFK